ncbi:MAG: glycoside hydrolase family 3 C-terminal domain-containing protein [Bacteroidales bacterium]|nr:glycoside hydrolase family 3 C-terminal domain-containing protein [Bacteroidales bacterium]
MKKSRILLAATVCVIPAFAQQQVWNDPSQPIERRITAMVSAMTLEEKVSQLSFDSPGIERLNIPEYNWWNEALHGVARTGRATVFPQCIGMAATFDDDLVYRVASAISDEARAKFNMAQSIGNRGQYAGLTFWSPNVNIFRDPRWGRGQETWGEDPYLTGRLASRFVKGMQGDDPAHLKTAACAKHYVVHSGPEALRHEFDAVPSQKDFFETYTPAFKMLVQDGEVEAVMGAYNRVFGEPSCGSPYLLTDLLRKEWGFKGHVVSDCGAIKDIYEGHKYAKMAEEAAAIALTSGVNLNCGNVYASALLNAVKQGLLTEDQVDHALSELLRTRFKLGLFDPKGTSPYDALGSEVIDSPEHRQIAREAAAKSVVLLKNDKNVLPLDKNAKKYYVLGPNATSTEALLGNYYGVSSDMRTLLEGVVAHVSPGTTVEYKYGVLMERENVNPVDWSTGEAHTADAIILGMGITGMLEGEEGESILSPYMGDRKTIELPESQVNYIKKLRAQGDKPIIMVVFGGSPIAFGNVADLVDAILFAWYPGEEGGNAVADVLFGDVNPSGRLPLTFPKSTDQLPPYEDYSMKGRTYRYMTEKPQYSFGYGLSYTTFSFDNAKLSKEKIRKGESVDASVRVSNNGNRAGEEVVQLYVKDMEANVDVPLSSLKDFKRVKLQPGETKEVTFTVTPEMMKIVNNEGKEVLEKGKFALFIGGVSPGERSTELGAPAPAKLEFTVK